MAQSLISIWKQPKNRGISLIELVLYMGLFIILVGGVLYSAFYLQKVLQYNAVEYKTQEDVYKQLNLLQQYLAVSTKVEISTTSIRIYGKYGYLEQYLENKVLHMKYIYVGKSDMDIVLYPYVKFEEFSFTQEFGHESISGKNILLVQIKRMDGKGKIKTLKEWIYVTSISK